MLQNFIVLMSLFGFVVKMIEYAISTFALPHIETYWMRDLIQDVFENMHESNLLVNLYWNEVPKEKITLLFLFQHKLEASQIAQIPKHARLIIVSVWRAPLSEYPPLSSSLLALFRRSEAVWSFWRWEVQQLREQGIDAIHVPIYRPSIPLPYPPAKKIFDCCFVGEGTPFQQKVMQALKEKGLRCKQIFQMAHMHRDDAFRHTHTAIFCSSLSESMHQSVQEVHTAFHHRVRPFAFRMSCEHPSCDTYEALDDLFLAIQRWTRNASAQWFVHWEKELNPMNISGLLLDLESPS